MTDRQPQQGLQKDYKACSVPKIAVDWLDKVPPLPLTSAVWAPATWRAPPLDPLPARAAMVEGPDSVVGRWLRPPYDVDGWRIDVANMTGRIRDEDMYLDVAQTVRRTMVDINPDTIMLGEYTSDAAYEVQGDGWQE